MDISIVVPLLNEEESLPELCTWIDKVMQANNLSYEVVMIDDGSTDDSWKIIQEIRSINANIKGIKFRRNYGKSAALNEGFKVVKGDVVVTMDADLQDSPDEVPEMHRMIMEDNYDIVSGWKKKRHDPITKTVPTKLYNGITRMASGIKLHDFNCGLKAYKKQVVKSVEVYGEMHRYIPVIAKSQGFKKIGEKVVQHQARKFGVTKFGMDRFYKGFLDLVSIYFMSKFGKRPMHFFGVLGALSFMVGFAITVWILVAKLIAIANGIKQALVADNPLFYLALVALIIGMQLFLAGFLGEMIARSAPDRNKYEIEEVLT